MSVYDAAGQRVATQVAGTLTNVLVYDAAGKLLAEYGSVPPATNGRQYVFSDHQGSPRTITSNSGSVASRHDYAPFGEDLTAGIGMRTSGQGYGSADSARQKYAGMESDDASGMAHTLWRQYDSLSGRWTAPDPYGGSMSVSSPQSFNRYSYVNNDPINLTDPSGLMTMVDASMSYGDVSGLWAGGGDPHYGGFETGRDIIANGMNGFLDRINNDDDSDPGPAAPEHADDASGHAEDTAGAGGGGHGDADATTDPGLHGNPQNPAPEDLLKSGTAEAADRLKVDPCAKFFGGTDKGLKALNSLKFAVDPSMPASGRPQAVIQGNNVRVNPHRGSPGGGGLVTPDGVGHMFILVERTKSAPNFLTVTLFGTDARAFGQLHETGHKAKRFGNTDNDLGAQRIMNGYENNFKIWKACFSSTPTQPWRGQPPLIQ